MSLPRAVKTGAAQNDGLHVTLDYGERLLRRKRLVCDEGPDFLVDLPRTTHLEPGEAFLLEDGRAVIVRAADENLLRVTGDLPRLAWHIGNRHTPCAVSDDHLTIQNDPVLRAMLEGLGAEIVEVQGPFRPEGGAYGHGRTMGHAHEH
ncbi:MAG: urease accessory protein UreE [Pseudomonadota bacterium]